jgi:hypothetical protein
MTPELDIVIPVYNEGRNIVAVLAALTRAVATPVEAGAETEVVVLSYDVDLAALGIPAGRVELLCIGKDRK